MVLGQKRDYFDIYGTSQQGYFGNRNYAGAPSISSLNPYFKKRFSWSFSRTGTNDDYFGRIFGMVSITGGGRSIARTKVIEKEHIDDGLISYIQPVHYHRWDALTHSRK